MNTTVHPTAVAVQRRGSGGRETAEEECSSLCKRLNRLFFASEVEPAVIRRCRTLALLTLLASVLDLAVFITSVFQARKALKYAHGAFELLLAGSLLSIGLYGALNKDVRHIGIYAMTGLLKVTYQVTQIVFGVFAVRTLQEELGRVEETREDPNELQFQVALGILHVLLAAADCVAYCGSSIAALLLREQIIKPLSGHVTNRYTTTSEDKQEGSQAHEV